MADQTEQRGPDDIFGDIKIIKDLPNKFSEISFRPIDLTSTTLNQETARQFCDNFRLRAPEFFKANDLILQTDYSQKPNQSVDVSSLDLIRVSGSLGIPMIMWQTANMSEMEAEGGHWQLMLENPGVEESSLVQMWDPNGQGLYENFITRDESTRHMYINAIADKIGDRYSLKIDLQGGHTEDLNQRLQIDDFNCGTTIFLNALLRANQLGYISDENRKKIDDNFGLKMQEIPGINAV